MIEVYYRIYMDREGDICIVTLQGFDERDYDQDRFLSEQKFESEEEAIQFLRDFDKPLPLVVQRAIVKFLGNSVKNILD